MSATTLPICPSTGIGTAGTKLAKAGATGFEAGGAPTGNELGYSGTNLIVNPTFATTGGTGAVSGGATGQVADGCTLALTGTGMTAAASIVAGKQRIALGGTGGTGVANFTMPASAVVVGNKYVGDIRIEGVNPAGYNVEYRLNINGSVASICSVSTDATTTATLSPGGPVAMSESFIRDCRVAYQQATVTTAPTISVVITAISLTGVALGGYIDVSLPRVYQVPNTIANAIDPVPSYKRVRIVFPVGASINGTDVGIAEVGLRAAPSKRNFMGADVSGSNSTGPANGTYTSTVDGNLATYWQCGAGLLSTTEQYLEYRVRTNFTVGAVDFTAKNDSTAATVSPTSFRIDTDPLSIGGSFISKGPYTISGLNTASQVVQVATP